MRRAQLFLICAIAFASAATDAKETSHPSLPDWMQGHWCQEQGPEKVEELWLPAAGRMMLGMSRTVAAGRRTQFEFQRIELIDGVQTFLAQPGGRAATPFKRTGAGDDWVRFENPAHDFPKRIEYRRNRDSLHAEIAGPGDDGVEISITLEFTRCPA